MVVSEKRPMVNGDGKVTVTVSQAYRLLVELVCLNRTSEMC